MEFFRDVLDGPVYIALVIVCLILIMAIIGFIMERKKLEKEANSKIIHVDNMLDSAVDPVSVIDEGVQQEDELRFVSPLIDLSEGNLVIENPNENVNNNVSNTVNNNINNENNNVEQVANVEKIPTYNTDLSKGDRVETPVIIFKDPDKE